jgi:Z1 domain
MTNTFDEARPLAAAATMFVPIIGETTEGLGAYLRGTNKLKTAEAVARVRNDALAIVRNCRPFHSPEDGSKTGLAIGYVQSGKTMSMTTVSALARDNGCRIIILLAGVTTNLLQQNAARFRKDLREASGSSSAWLIHNSESSFGSKDVQHLQRAIEDWKDPSVRELDKKTFLYMVLKNHRHLDGLAKLLSNSAIDLRGIPALVLDDEADQAGLNTKPKAADSSTTYKRIQRVRSALPHHTYLQYTATPQAPLLIALDDMLSPAFAELVQPGDGYTGGQTFFGLGAPQGLVHAIPEHELFGRGDLPDEPPESLLTAMRAFFIGAAVSSVRKQPRPCSMLMHPSRGQRDHRQYVAWVQAIIGRWTSGLRSKDDGERSETLDEFRPAYADLLITDAELPRFDDLVYQLQRCVSNVHISEVNSDGGDDNVDWENADNHILIGGDKLNRGFTVEGLTVTYMPRSPGEWNADTIQQRARFFGYKQSYLGLCRLYLHPEVIHAYRAYVRHEEDVRSQISEHRGRPLREWRRAFFLDSKLKPTRRNVLSIPYYRIAADRLWFRQEQPHVDADAATRNAARLRKLVDGLSFEADPQAFFEHKVATTPLEPLFRDVLVSYEVRESDAAKWYGHLVTLRDILDNAPDTQVIVLQMDGGSTRERGVKDEAIKLHQGVSSAQREDKYPGDAAMHDASSKVVTLQIHWLTIKDAPDLRSPVPAIAMHIPSALRKDDAIAQG